MTFAELKTQLQALGYGTDSDTVQGLVINAAYRKIARSKPWWWLRTEATVQLTPGQIDYTWTSLGISSNPPRRLESARLIDTTVSPATVLPLKWITPQQFNDFRGALATTWPASERETPQWWTRLGGSSPGISVWAPPDLAYTFHLNYTGPAAVLSGAGEPAMPRDYHDVIVWEAAYAMAVRQRDAVMIAEARSERDQILHEMRAEDNAAQLRDYERVGGKEIWTDLDRRI